ncbi:cation transporter [Rhodocyclaceae bacterium SMB388]
MEPKATTSECGGGCACSQALTDSDDAMQRNVLWWLLGINAFMFVAEFGAGLWAQSAGLIADSLDMFADATVYALALYAVGRSAALKLRAAHLSGWFQMLLALGALLEVGRRVLFGAEPMGAAMMAVAAVALVANVTCLLLIAKHRHGGAHMRASFIFSANDVIANCGVILAGLLVAMTGSAWPDWIIGVIIAAVVFNGAIRILRLR